MPVGRDVRILLAQFAEERCAWRSWGSRRDSALWQQPDLPEAIIPR